MINRAPQHAPRLSISISWLCGSTDAALLLASLLLKESVVPKALQSPRYVRLAVAGRLAASSFWPPDDDELGGHLPSCHHVTLLQTMQRSLGSDWLPGQPPSQAKPNPGFSNAIAECLVCLYKVSLALHFLVWLAGLLECDHHIFDMMRLPHLLQNSIQITIEDYKNDDLKMSFMFIARHN